MTAPSTDRVPELVREAFRVALAPRCGPVQVNLPRDVLAGTADFDAYTSPGAYRNQTVPAADTDAVAQAASLLVSADRPVIVAGGGIKNTAGHEAATGLAPAKLLAEVERLVGCDSPEAP